MSSSRTLSTLLGIAAIVLWSTTVAFGRSLTEQLGPLTSASLIYAFGGVLGCAYQAIAWRSGDPRGAASGRPGLVQVFRSFAPRYLIGCGGLFVLYMACLYLALGLARGRAQALEVGLMNYLWPMLTLLLSVPILHTQATLWLVPGVVAATAGVLLATTQNHPLSWPAFLSNLSQNATPYVLGALAALSWALYSNLSRRWGGGRGGAVTFFMLGTGVVLGVARLLTPEETLWTRRAWFELVGLALSSNLAYAFWEQAMRKGDIVLVASCSYFTPLLSTMVSILYLGIVPGVKLWIGCALVIGGAIVCKLAVKE